MGFKMQPKMRVRYWSNSSFATFIRKVLKAPEQPEAATMEDWNAWTRNQKKNHKFAYWLTDTGLKKLQNFFYYPYDVYYSVQYYLINRFIKKTHYLPTRLEAGEYHSVSERILHGLFETLVDYVEISLAKRDYFYNPDRYENTPFKRSREAGLNYLIRMCCDMDDGKLTKHADEAQAIFHSYNWWKRRPYRPDPGEVSGFHEFGKKFRQTDVLFLEFTNELDSKRHTKLYNKMNEIYEMYAEEDQKEMIQLIKIIDTLR